MTSLRVVGSGFLRLLRFWKVLKTSLWSSVVIQNVIILINELDSSWNANSVAFLLKIAIRAKEPLSVAVQGHHLPLKISNFIIVPKIFFSNTHVDNLLSTRKWNQLPFSEYRINFEWKILFLFVSKWLLIWAKTYFAGGKKIASEKMFFVFDY